MQIARILISLSLVLIVSLILKIEIHHILVILIISTIMLFILAVKDNKFENQEIKLMNQHIEMNMKNNMKNNMINNIENNTNKQIIDSGYKNCKLMTTNDNIIDPCSYNLEDCTTDMSCIIKPDENNLFPKNEIKNKVHSIIKPKVKKQDDIVVENFISTVNPFQMNDVSQPFDPIKIDPYQYYKVENNEVLGTEKCNKILKNKLCMHCKLGYCFGGVCGKNINYDIKDDSLEIDINPFSDSQPVIRSSNPDLPS